jgi:hypothetical protein
MSPIENHVDWRAPATPGNERLAPSLSQPRSAAAPAPKPTTLDKLLGDANLTACDSTGNDPYNATGRQFRR